MSKTYTFRNLSESEIESLLATVATQKLYRRAAIETKVNSIESMGTFLDGTPKYFIKIETDDTKLIERFQKNERKI